MPRGASACAVQKVMGGSLASKPCGLGPAGFPRGLRSVAATAVSLYGQAAVLPSAGLDCHLDRTLILARPLASSLGIFFDNTPFPSLFCRLGFSSRRPRRLLAGVGPGLSGLAGPLLHPPHPLKAGYAAPSTSPCFSTACRCSLHRSPVARIGATATRAGLHGKRVVRPHAVAGRPQSGSSRPSGPVG